MPTPFEQRLRIAGCGLRIFCTRVGDLKSKMRKTPL